MKPRYYSMLLIALAWAAHPLRAQFILPEKDYTTQSDIDVIRVDSSQTAVINIRAEMVNPSVGEVLINWRNAKQTSRLTVVRSDIPISNIRTLLDSKAIAIVEGTATVYRDIPNEPGNYYYAVVSRQALEDQTAIMTPEANYTLQPVTILSSDKQKFTTLNIVKNIRARFLDSRTIRVQWDYDPNPYVYFIVYRSTRPIDSTSILDDSVRLGMVRGGKNYYDDSQPPVGQKLYYAVTTTDSSEKENRHLDPGNSYTTSGIIMEIGEIPTVKNISAERSGEVIHITWETDIVNGEYEYILYRSRNPILDQATLKQASIIAYIGSSKSYYNDAKVASGDYYYAIITQNTRGELSESLIPNGNTMTNPAQQAKLKEPEPDKEPDKTTTQETPPQQGPAIFDNFAAHAATNRVVISWQRGMAPLPAEGAAKVYRFRQKPRDMRDIVLGTPIGKLDAASGTLEDRPPVSGAYYYALFFETSKGLFPPRMEEYQNLVGPIDYRGGKKYSTAKTSTGYPNNEEPYLTDGEADLQLPDYMVPDSEIQRSDTELNLVLKETFLKKDYEAALRELAPFRQAPAKPIRAKALFYSGMANYYIGDYQPALDNFINPVVREIYGERADFWYRRTLESMEK